MHCLWTCKRASIGTNRSRSQEAHVYREATTVAAAAGLAAAGLAALQLAMLGKRVHLRAGDHEMVEYAHVDHGQRLHQRTR